MASVRTFIRVWVLSQAALFPYMQQVSVVPTPNLAAIWTAIVVLPSFASWYFSRIYVTRAWRQDDTSIPAHPSPPTRNSNKKSLPSSQPHPIMDGVIIFEKKTALFGSKKLTAVRVRDLVKGTSRFVTWAMKGSEHDSRLRSWLRPGFHLNPLNIKNERVLTMIDDIVNANSKSDSNSTDDVKRWLDASVGMVSILLALYSIVVACGRHAQKSEVEEREPLLGGGGRTEEISPARLKADAANGWVRSCFAFVTVALSIQIISVAFGFSETWTLDAVAKMAGAATALAWLIFVFVFALQAFCYIHQNALIIALPTVNALLWVTFFHLVAFIVKIGLEITSTSDFVTALIETLIFALLSFLFSTIDDQVETLEDEIALENKRIVPSRTNRCGFIGTMFFSWMNSVVRMGNRVHLTMREVPDLEDDDKAKNTIRVFNEKRGRFKSLYVSLMTLYPGLLATQVFLQFLGAILTTVEPLLIYVLIGAASDKNRHRSEVLLFSTLLFLAIIIHGLFRQVGFQIGRRIGARFFAILINEVYSKALRRVAIAHDNDEDHGSASIGRIVSLMSSDAKIIREAMPYLFDIVLVSLEISGAIGALLYIVGWPGLVGLSVMIASFPATYFVSKWITGIVKLLSAATDARTTVINEVLQGIRIIKYLGWENRFEERISETRLKELKQLIGFYGQRVVTSTILYLLPNLVAYSTLFAITQWQGRVLDAQLAFTCLALFGAIQNPMSEIPELSSQMFQIGVAMGRMQAFLDEEECEHLQAGFGAGVYSGREEHLVGFRKGVFRWFFNPRVEDLGIGKKAVRDAVSDSSPLLPGNADAGEEGYVFTLHNLNLSFPVGKLTAVCGPTGCGKSSLLMALLGEMHRVSGQRFLPASDVLQTGSASPSVAYVAQTSWLRNATIRENILFGEPYDANRYAQVIYGCSLDRDLATFEAGDLTEIGEKGINLSGGQKQRVSLARAAYSSAKFVLLDDPLSAVDAPTARHLLFETILGLMKGRTVLLVTHATHLVLPVADFVVVMEGGRVVADGGVVDVVGVPAAVEVLGLRNEDDTAAEEGVDFMSVQGLLKAVEAFRDGTAAPLIEAERLKIEENIDFSNGKRAEEHRLVKAEAVEVGSVKLGVYVDYFRAAGGWWLVMAILVVMVAGRFTNIASSYWIREWTNRLNETVVGEDEIWSAEGKDSKKDALYFVNVYLLLSLTWVFLYAMVVVVRSIGSYAASKHYHARLIHHILHAPMRFFDTTPIGRILNRTTGDIGSIDQNIMVQITSFVGSVIELGFILGVIGLITPLFFVGMIPAVAAYYLIGKRYLKVSIELRRLESITRSPIYALFSETLNGVSTIRAYSAEGRLIKENLGLIDCSNRAFYYIWGISRWLNVRLSTISAVLLLVCGVSIALAGDRIDAGLVGIALTWAIRVSEFLKTAVRNFSAMEMSIQTVERVREYTEIEQEASAVIEGNRVPKDDISFDVAGGEKLGVVGRTGAGKSSLSLSLFRIVEPSGGRIVIDGIDISTIGLEDLRKSLTIIPQDPVLFRGSVRSNLDPFGEVEDERILEVLENVRFFDTLQKADGGDGFWDVRVMLDEAVAEGGKNFSLGQRQLICLARAMLRGSRVMVLDEATASVDNETDTKIQEVIRDKTIADVTVVAIAHRLRTVIDYDRILVLENGKVAQHGTPLELMMVDGIFRGMCEEGGDFEELLATAREASVRKWRR
ncbi:hypothetical protein HDU97_002493 [Phlyctochytrium planicorne]|nr:hypothetical protein HDU97_002493 [Phlyctochytrium planicorne]